MSSFLKVNSLEESVNTTPTAVSNAKVVRLSNFEAATNVLITQKNDGGDTLSTFTLGFAGSDESTVYLIKAKNDTIEADGDALNLKAVSVAYY
jgi:hypothetical protein